MRFKDNVLRIEPIKPLEEGEFMAGMNTKISLGGRDICGVESIDIQYRPQDVVRATVNLLAVQHTLDGVKCLFQIRDPVSGVWQEVDRIVLRNGEEILFYEDLFDVSE